MNHINFIQVEGNIVANAELTYTNQGYPMAKFTIGNSVYNGKGRESFTSFFNCVLWGSYAEKMQDSLTKGTHVVLYGQARIENYTDKQGQKRSAFKLSISNNGFVRVIPKRVDSGYQQNYNAYNPQQQQTQQYQTTNPATPPQPASGQAPPLPPSYPKPNNSAQPPTGAEQVRQTFGGEFEDDIPF